MTEPIVVKIFLGKSVRSFGGPQRGKFTQAFPFQQVHFGFLKSPIKSTKNVYAFWQVDFGLLKSPIKSTKKFWQRGSRGGTSSQPPSHPLPWSQPHLKVSEDF